MSITPRSKLSKTLRLFKLRTVITHPVLAVPFALFALIGLAIEAIGYYQMKIQSEKDPSGARANNALRIVAVCHYLHCLVAIHFARQSSKKVPEFIKSWLKLNRTALYQRTTSQAPISRVGFISSLYCFGGVIAFSAFIFAVSFHSSIERVSSDFDFDEAQVLLIIKDFAFNEGHYQMLKCVAVAVTALPNLYMQGMYATFCGIIYCEFCFFQEHFEAFCEEPPVASTVGAFREQHFLLSKLTSAVDEMASYYLAWVHCLNLPCVGVIAYCIMLDRSLSTRVLLLLIGWLLFFLLQFLLCCVPAAAIMTKAHAPLLTLEDLVNFEPSAHRDQEGENSNTDQLLRDDYPAAYWIGAELFRQVSLFVQQLTGSVVGITCGGFFFIRKEALLTLSSALITYFALLLRMNLSSGNRQCECNCASSAFNSTERAGSSLMSDINRSMEITFR